MVLCPICASDSILANSVHRHDIKTCWLECTNCGWETERISVDIHNLSVWQELEKESEKQRG